ncbi:type II secretion system protein GspG [Leptospira sp. GIMC2001]|uniref:type II secretion system protein GspG n=1 Tax=Leptospira sp. GIMC2001 TaxID=1513297 RepID=UPI00234B9BA4|nr:type II secretion system protein GspG [Leptospira sp. GIMC2001]WCL47937.1 type II secretion system protein GspG [Leptospira sp. GIMC2001]
MKTNKSKFKIAGRSFRRGLTLIEIAVVVMILGALIAIVAVNINPGELKDDTAALQLKKDAQELQMHLERYAQRYGTYPSPEQGLIALVEKPTVGDNIPEDYNPIIKKKSGVEDPWGTPYILRVDEYGELAIYSLGKDKKDGGDGKNADFNILNEDEYPSAFKRR